MLAWLNWDYVLNKIVDSIFTGFGAGIGGWFVAAYILKHMPGKDKEAKI